MSADPIDKLIAAGATPRELIAYPLDAIELLAKHQRETFRLCYHDEAGAVVVENVKAHLLLRRAAELGWKPHGEDLWSQFAMNMFDNALYHLRRGVHWYASATDDSDAMLPLAWPAATLARNAAREERKSAAYRRKLAAKQKKAEKEQAKQRRIKNRESMDFLIAHEMKNAENAGKPIGRRRARFLVNALLGKVRKVMPKDEATTFAATFLQDDEGLQRAKEAIKALPPRANIEGVQ
ncbi:hypothetical protein [Xanthomonas sp. WHRI 7945]|nr:hypothetical protein [Xanthomonas campestris pv. campestris]